MEGQDMTDYTKLVKALRLCQFGECGCGKCYYKELKGDWCTEDNHPEFFDCDDKLKLDAAAAIEELQAELVGSKDAIRILKHNLEMKKPKRGVWKPFDLTYGRSIYSCSVCEQATEVPMCMEKPMYAYCPNCGAKMEANNG